MTDLIHLLPDAIANQIAAGEVVQRPASVVKELMENTIDAGAGDIKLIVKDAGKMLIQVIDNGCGMSERDARMCFERHATSKIHKADDLLAIQTLGFRGEALASIAAVSQVELKSKRRGDEIGTCVQIEGTEVKAQFPVNCPDGTSVSVKNLFFNVPARRSFLKSNNLELKYILDEFFRVALVNPHVSFTFYNQDKILYQMPSGHLKERILNLYGSSYGQKLIPLEQQTPMVNISGFLGKPEFAKKTRGEQFFFTNRRFMKNAYFHHAVETAFKELIPDDSTPSYFIFLEVDPHTIDVNIHPTKSEINFQDNKSIYAILHAAVRQSLGRFNLAPSLDFEKEPGMDPPPLPAGYQVRQPTITVTPGYNPFTTQRPAPDKGTHHPASHDSIHAWNEMYAALPKPGSGSDNPPLFPENQPEVPASRPSVTGDKKVNIQVNATFLITHTKTGIVILDQNRAHERILYERFLKTNQPEKIQGQHLLLPPTITLNPDDTRLLQEWISHFSNLGFEISHFGKNSFLVHTLPPDVPPNEVGPFIESVLESLKTPAQDARLSKDQKLAKAMACRLAVKRGTRLHPEEIDSIIENLFACQVPDLSPDGKPVMMVLPFSDLIHKLKIT
ncbi:MAG: DNA mismatch repair endonuclease MutL [Bacteroidales bacterium]|nr:DNA mismatch repair endonuclease MutL [Bacteroidales bacterium]HNW73390.1 DNA mismatch repair endonuclease MutL [Bacteroidales bacterium]HPS50782.1 DNA mismatch repair endonuclease MutL [Bacteroidales bacterium]